MNSNFANRPGSGKVTCSGLACKEGRVGFWLDGASTDHSSRSLRRPVLLSSTAPAEADHLLSMVNLSATKEMPCAQSQQGKRAADT